MKRNTMNAVRTFGLSVFILALIACEQPFRAGLGKVVDTRPPTVSLLSPGAGDFIWGSRAFIGRADDDYILDRVELKVSNYPEIDYLREFVHVNLIKKAQSEGEWNYSIDTTKFPDGDLKILIKAVDSANKDVMTDEIVFLVKNEPPAISVTTPFIPQGEKDGEVGGKHLNYEAVNALPAVISFPRQTDGGSILSGNISDQDDIYTGKRDGVNFPPQIRMWRVNDMSDPRDTGGFPPGVLPPYEGETDWQDFELNKNLFMLGIGNYQFTWVIPSGMECFYGFEIRAQSKDGRTQFHYPRDFWPNINPDSWDDLSVDGDFKQENRYVLIHVRLSNEVPDTEIYGLQDILGPDGWNGTSYNAISGVDDNMDHPYVNKVTVNKNGPFTLRIWASHSDGISAAEVYWEKDDKSDRGRFIWDLADNPLEIPGWEDKFNVKPDRPYSEWGFRDPHDAFKRNFIFTYNHDGNDRVPDGERYNKQVRGRSKIQRYKPDDIAAWQERKRDGSLPLADVFAGDIWEEMDTLDEGFYTVEVYARSSFGKPVKVPFTCTIGLDWTAPEAEITTIEGAFSEDLINNEAVVNGVIRPRLRFSDSRPQDSGLRTASDNYYLRPSSSVFGYEQRYILVGEFDNVEMDKLIAYGAGRGGWWPPTPAAVNDVLEIPGVTVFKHGPIFDSSCMFKTSKIGDEAADVLADGDYWLYVFVRDIAFNAGRIAPLKISVKEETDRPVFDFLGSVNPNVTNPNPSHDNHPDADGFWYGGTVRNKFGPNSAVRLRMSDDDSLALGFDAAGNENESTVKISFIGSYMDSYGAILPYDEADSAFNMELTDSDVKEIFTPLPGTGRDNFRPILERQGEISQIRLLNLLRGKPAYDYLFIGDKNSYSSLPDGIYRISISVMDYSPAKLPDGLTAAKPIENKAQFWINVDTINPEITNVLPASGGWITPEDGIAPGKDGIVIAGNISDRNGPVMVKDLIIRDEKGAPVSGATDHPLNVPENVNITPVPVAKQWEGSFRAAVYMDKTVSAEYIITLRFEDRFGRLSTKEQRYKYDIEPPRVSLRKYIDTFERNFPNDVNLGTPGDISENNLKNLSNGVVSFIISSFDNLKVAETRWWLLPYGATLDAADIWNTYINYDTLPDGSKVFNSYKDASLLNDKARAGRFTGNSNTPVYIDTKTTLLDKTEYALYVMAQDEAGNVSVYGNIPLQNIFVLQEEDKPYFGSIFPRDGAVVGETDAVVRGTVFDDDGFFLADNSGNIMPDTIKIRVKNDGGPYSQWVTATSIITPLGSKNISLNIDLSGIPEFNGIFAADGLKWYQIEAADSWNGKFIDEKGTAAAAGDNPVHRVTRQSKEYSFLLDTVPPEIDISSPVIGETFGKNAGDDNGLCPFTIKGSISDTHLKTNASGNYFIRYRLDNGGLKEYDLGVGPNTPGITNPVNFTIKASAFTGHAMLNFHSDAVTPGNHTLTFLVEDESGKSSTFLLSFIKDTAAPVLELLNIEPVIMTPGWFNDAHNSVDRERDKGLTVIHYDGTVPFITGSFTDVSSNVDRNTFRLGFNTDVPDIQIPVNQIEGDGKFVRWTVYLTQNGTDNVDPINPILPDGMHSIVMEITDTVGNESTDANLYGFRINSQTPAAVLMHPVDNVIGDANGPDTEKVFTASGSGMSRNLANVQLSIRYLGDSAPDPFTRSLFKANDQDNAVTNTWIYAATDIDLRDIMETLEWALDITRADLKKAGGSEPDGRIKQGSYELSVVTEDMRGIKSEETGNNVWTFTIDSAQAEFEFSNLHYGAGDPVNRPPAYWLNDGARENRNRIQTPRIRGRVFDALSNLKKVELQIRKWDYAASEWQVYNFDTETWGPINGDANKWQDLLSVTPSPPSMEFRLDWEFTGINEPQDGYYCIQLRAEDMSVITGGIGGNPVDSPFVYFFLDRNNPALEHEGSTTSYSSRIAPDWTLPFSVTASDDNRFEKMEVTVERINTVTGNLPPVQTVTTFTPSEPGKWVSTANLKFIPDGEVGGLPDGAYRIVFSVTDLSGRTATINRTITLDNRPPSVIISEPRFIGIVTEHTIDGEEIPQKPLHYYAGDTVIGGEPFVIQGNTDDVGANGSASGVAGIWYRLGYGNHTALPVPGNTAESRRAAIASWAIQDLRDRNLLASDDRGVADNAAFDNAAQNTSNLPWFKYTLTEPGGTPTYPVPDGFSNITAVDLYNWALDTQTSLAGYASLITVKGQTYNNESGRFMARAIEENKLPLVLRRGGLYSLPLAVRIVDNAGNAHYDLCDIWIYPNGDNPSTVIINPSVNFSGYSDGDTARGGTVSVEGVASDNNSVRRVIYRIKAGGTPGNGPGTAPSDAYIVTLPGNEAGWEKHNEYAAMETVWDGKNIAESKSGWYVAALESESFAPNMPWSFMLNAGDEIKDLIEGNGFRYDASSNTTSNVKPYNMIRVWVEIFVFDGQTASAASGYNRMSLGDDNKDANNPKPYIREFYLKDTSPVIQDRELSKQGDITSFAEYSLLNNVRSGKFAIRAGLNGSGANISQISVKLPGETDNTWQTAWDRTRDYELPGISLDFSGDQNEMCTMTYAFDPSLATSTTQFRAVRGGSWANSGGKFTVDVRVRDVTDPPGEAIYTFEIGIDNFAPVADKHTYITPNKVAGTNVNFLGRVFDFDGISNISPRPEYREIKSVYAWFTGRDNRYINMNKSVNDNTSAPSVATRSVSVFFKPPATVTYSGSNNATAHVTKGDQGTTVPQDIPTDEDYVKIISQETAGVLSNRITWQPSTQNSDVFWSFEADTTVMKDGWITMHYVVFDHAGNASYYAQQMVVMNNYPGITGVTLYTNNTGEGAVFTTHEGNEAYSEFTIPDAPYSAGYLNSRFIAKNKVIGFGVDTISGNAPLHYRVQYVERYEIPLTIGNLGAMANKTGTLTDKNNTTVTGIVNLYTIVNERVGGVSPDAWAMMGVHKPNPAAGMHFVFQVHDEMFSGTAGSYTASADYPGASVYAYKALQTHNTVTPDGDVNHVPPSLLNFSGDNYFSLTDANKINEAQGINDSNAAVGNTNGMAFFLIKVWDTVDDKQVFGEDDMLYDAVVVAMRVYLQDTTPPTIRLYDLNPYTETAVNGNNNGDLNRQSTIDDAAAPTAIGTNILRGGLYNTNTERAMVKSGYIEPRHNTNALQPRIKDPYTGGYVTTDAHGYYAGDANSPFPAADSKTLADSHANDRVSGKVLLRGLAYDDQLIDEIGIQIGTGQLKTILKLQDIVTESGTVRRMMPVTGNTSWGSPRPAGVSSGLPAPGQSAWAVETLHWETGHTVEWAYLWDTEFEPSGGMPQTGVQIIVTVKDKNGDLDNGSPVNTNAENESTNTFRNRAVVDIVPYIYGFERERPKYATTRSRQGWYSFSQSEPNIAVLGYNLGTSTTGTVISLYNGSVTTVTDNRSYTNRHIFAMPGTVNSGRIDVTVNSTPAYNHSSSHANKSWNREYNAYTSGSDLWVNKPYAHVWRTGNSDTSPATYFVNSTGLDSPSMALQYTGTNAGRLHGVWSTYGNESFYYSTNATNGGTRVTLAYAGEPYSYTDIDFYNTTGGNGTTYASVTASYQRDGGAFLKLKGNIDAGFNSTSGGNDFELDEATATPTIGMDIRPSATDRWQNGRVRKAGVSTANNNPGRAFVVSYDSVYQRLYFNNRNGANNVNIYYLDGGGASGAGIAAGITDNNEWGTITRSQSAGKWSAVDYDSSGNPVVVYYDEANDTLRLAYPTTNVVDRSITVQAYRTDNIINYIGHGFTDNQIVRVSGAGFTSGTNYYIRRTSDNEFRLSATSGGGNITLTANAIYNITVQPGVGGHHGWERRYVLQQGSQLFRGSGTYVSMKIQRTKEGDAAEAYNDTIHLAFFNSARNTVVYAVGKKNESFTTYIVDNVVNGGAWTDISLEQVGNDVYPWIVYADSTRIGNRDGARIAYKSSSLTRTLKDSTGAVITGWEAITMPADYVVNDDRLNIAVWPPQHPSNVDVGTRLTGQTWNAAVGYGSDMFRIGYFTKPAADLMTGGWQVQTVP